MNYPDIQKIFDEQNLLCFGGPSSECPGCKFGNCYGCSDLRLLEAYEAAIKLEIEAEVNKQKLDNIELAQCNVELGKKNERLRESLEVALRQWKMYIEDGNQCDIESIDSDNIESELCKQAAEALEGK